MIAFDSWQSISDTYNQPCRPCLFPINFFLWEIYIFCMFSTRMWLEFQILITKIKYVVHTHTHTHTHISKITERVDKSISSLCCSTIYSSAFFVPLHDVWVYVCVCVNAQKSHTWKVDALLLGIMYYCPFHLFIQKKLLLMLFMTLNAYMNKTRTFTFTHTQHTHIKCT